LNIEVHIGIVPIHAPLTFLWVSSLSTDKALEDSLFSAFFRGLGCFVNDRWGSTSGQNKGGRYLSQSYSSLIRNINLNRKKKFSWGSRALGLRMAPVL
jgi:hypothetical protein